MAGRNIFLNDEKYEKLNDEQLIEIIHNKDMNALNCLMDRYNDVVNMKASKFFIIGAEKEDIIQEGMIGLYKAVKSYDIHKQNSFKTFANMCIERQLITAVKNSNRQKHIPLNSSLSLNSAAYDENDDVSVIEVLETKTVEDPLDIITQKEYYSSINKQIEESLSDFEKQVLKQYKQGKSYATIAKCLNIKIKSVDTAIQRIRKKALKIKKNIEQKNA